MINVKNPYYNNSKKGGWNPAITGNYPRGSSRPTGYHESNVLPNCVGFAIGRFNQIIGKSNCKYYFGAGNAGTFYGKASAYGCKTGSVPQVGAIICWSKPGAAGHVAVVEKVISNDTIELSESGWEYSTSYADGIKAHKGDGSWTKRDSHNWMVNAGYRFQGFIYSPFKALPDHSNPTEKITFDTYAYMGGPYTETQVEYKTAQKEIAVKSVKTAEYDGVLTRSKATNLLSYPSLVESPYIKVDIGGISFGSYSKYDVNGVTHVDYPNYLTSLNVTKVNGSVNQYTINMQYQIRYGDDPNMIDKILSSVGYSTIKISYGDWQSPAFIYKEEEALITKVTSTIDFSSSRINYVIYCTSNSLSLCASMVDFPAKHAKPSDIIKEVFKDNKYGLQDIFYGMKTSDLNLLIASDDLVVNIDAQPATDPLSYINYLVTCMIANTNSPNKIILDSSYYMAIHDDKYSDNYNGPYFTVEKVLANSGSIKGIDIYEVDIGYPSDNMVMQFNISNDTSWALVYNYNGEINRQDYQYKIDNQGRMQKIYSPDITTSANKYITTPSQKNWWTQMTQFPISATLTIKGLIRPAMLLTYIKVNALFFGQRHISSGLYFVTKQQDTVDGKGYRTTLSLQRFAGDDDYITSEQKTVSYQVAVYDNNVPHKGIEHVNEKNKAPTTEYTKVMSDGREAHSKYTNVSELTDNQINTLKNRGGNVTYTYTFYAPKGVYYYMKKQQGFIKKDKLTQDFEPAEVKQKNGYTRIDYDKSNWYVKNEDFVDRDSSINEGSKFKGGRR